MKSCEGIGKNIEKAIEDALFKLRATREDVDIKILSQGGILKKARVLVTISEDAISKYEKRNSLIEAEKKSQEQKVVTKTEENLPTEKPQQKEKEPSENQNLKKEEKPKENLQKPSEGKVVEPIAFLTGLFEKLGKTITVNVKEDEKYITYSVEGEDLGETIGKRGETYYAISKLLIAVLGKQDKKVLLDIDGYKAKREESLVITAKKIADKVAKSGRYYRLEPMRPSERRIIHSALANDDRVTTLSKGTEPRRYVIVFPKEYKDR